MIPFHHLPLNMDESSFDPSMVASYDCPGIFKTIPFASIKSMGVFIIGSRNFYRVI